MSTIFELVYLNKKTGELGKVPNLGIANIGGSSGTTFTVGGRGLLFADGTSTAIDSGPGLNLSLQGAYENSVPAQLDLSLDKNFVIHALNNKFFSVDASTGKVTITGDLEVLGSSTIIEGTVSNLDQVIISPPTPTT